MKEYIREIPIPSHNECINKNYQVVIVGGGMSGLIAAIASSRQGAKTAIIQDRSIFGGNASSEMRMHISGASCHWGKRDAAETGILMELQLENKYLNDSYNYSIWDGVLWSKAKSEKNLDIYLNTMMDLVDSKNNKIQYIECYQTTTENKYRFTADVYVDATGNGTLGYFAGAEYAIGRENKEDYKEKDAPDKRDGDTMGNTIYFVAEDVGHPVKFIKPPFAYTFDESDFIHRYHGDIVVYHNADDVVVLKPNESYEDHRDELVEKYDVKSGYWWIELGGDYVDIIKQSEDIRWELYKTVYGVWDHIKNRGNHGADNYELTWVGNMGGMRESRRLIGNYVLTENDCLSNRVFDDGIAYGGWPLDEHTAGGFHAKGQIPSKVRSFDGFYSIPYGCYCSKNITNLMMCGRDISCSKLAMGSTRVMGTCSVGGEAVGIAAANVSKMKITPKEYGEKYIKELRQELLKQDLYIIGCKNEDKNDKALTSKVVASSYLEGYEAKNVISGVTRREKDNSNMWQSNKISKDGEVLSFKLNEKSNISEIRLIFDPDLSEERCISVSKAFIEKEPKGVAKNLVKDYYIQIINDGEVVCKKVIENNYQRLNIISLDKNYVATDVKITFMSSNGHENINVYEVRIY